MRVEAVDDGAGPEAGERPARWLALGVLLLAAAYTLHRAVVLRLEYFDGVDYLTNALRLGGERGAPYFPERFAFICWLYVPAVSLVRAAGEAGAAAWVIPHLQAAVLSLLVLVAIYRLLRQAVSPALAALGTATFAASRLFVRYGAHTLSDLPVTGLAAWAFWLYARPDGAGRRRAIASGAVLGLAIAAKYSAGVLLAGLVVAEGLDALGRQRIDRRRWLDLGLTLATAAAVAAGVLGLAFLRVYGGGALAALAEAEKGHAGANLSWDGGAWTGYPAIAAAVLGAPLLVLAAGGVALALAEREPRDLPLLGWLVTLGPVVVLLQVHKEGRYLLPLVPPLLYFALRLAEAAGRGPGGRQRLATGLALVALVASAWSGLDQALRDRDPVFRADLPARAVRLGVERLRPGGRLLWLGARHTWFPRHPHVVPNDQGFNIFQFASRHVPYLSAGGVEPLPPIAPERLAAVLPAVTRDGDVILRAADRVYFNLELPDQPLPPFEVWSVERRVLACPAGAGECSDGQGGARIRIRSEPGVLMLAAVESLGRWDLSLARAGATEVLPLGTIELGAGQPYRLSAEGLEAPELLVLHRIGRETVE